MNRKATAAKFAGEGYTISVVGRHVDVTEAMKAYAIEKIGKLEKFHHRMQDVVITMDVQKLKHKVDIVLKIDQILVKSHAESEDMYASIDLAVDKLSRQVSDYKDRIQTHQAKPQSAVDMLVNVFSSKEKAQIEAVNDEIYDENMKRLEESYKPHKIVSQEVWPLKSLNYEEALWHMELANEPFLIYRCEEDQKLKVLYRRRDGDFGVVEVVS
jgi:putative sigma-54 modulation protein